MTNDFDCGWGGGFGVKVGRGGPWGSSSWMHSLAFSARPGSLTYVYFRPFSEVQRGYPLLFQF